MGGADLSEVRDAATQQLVDSKYNDYIDGLVKQANVTVRKNVYDKIYLQ